MIYTVCVMITDQPVLNIVPGKVKPKGFAALWQIENPTHSDLVQEGAKALAYANAKPEWIRYLSSL